MVGVKLAIFCLYLLKIYVMLILAVLISLFLIWMYFEIKNAPIIEDYSEDEFFNNKDENKKD